MAQLILDLSGGGGLGNNFFGDSDTITPKPSLRYDIEDGELASGIFNPFIRVGYLHPSITNLHSVTTSETLSSVIGSVVYDSVLDFGYFAERGRGIFQSSTLDDTSLTRIHNTSAGVDINDLEIYEINSSRYLLYPYTTAKARLNTVISGGAISGSYDWYSQGIEVQGTSSTITPYSLGTVGSSGTGSGASGNITYSAGTNVTAVVLVIQRGLPAQTIDSATFDSSAMTAHTESSFSTGTIKARAFSFNLSSEVAATKAWTVTFSGSVDYHVAVIMLENTLQTSSVIVNETASNSASTNALVDVAYTSVNSFFIQSVISASGTNSIHSPEQNTIYNNNTTHSVRTGSFSYSPKANKPLDCGVANLPFSDSNDTWLSATVSNPLSIGTNSNYNFIRVADNGFAYLFANHRVIKIDGSVTGGDNGTLTKDVLLFPKYFRFADAIDYRGLLYIALHQNPTDTTDITQTNFNTPCGVYVWDRFSYVSQTKDYIPIEGVRQIKKIYIAPSGALRMITISANGITQIREFTGSFFQVIKELGIGASPRFPDSLVVSGYKTMWLAPDGNLYCHGTTKLKGIDILSIIGNIQSPSAETTAGYSENITPGAVLYGAGTTTVSSGFRGDRQGLTLSYDPGAAPVVKKLFPFDVSPVNSVNQTGHIGNVYSLVKFLPTLSTVKNVVIRCAPTGTGTTTIATIKYYFNQSATVGMTKTVTKDEASKGYLYHSINKPNINSIQIEIEWSTSETLGADTFTPSVALVEFEPTNTSSPDNG